MVFFVARDKTLPGLDDLEDIDPILASIINETIRSEIKHGPKLAKSQKPPPGECQPPKPSGYIQTARVLLSQLGLLNSQSLEVSLVSVTV